MNMTEVCEYDQNLTTTNVQLVNLTEISCKSCHDDENYPLNMTENQNILLINHNGKLEIVTMTENK